MWWWRFAVPTSVTRGPRSYRKSRLIAGPAARGSYRHENGSDAGNKNVTIGESRGFKTQTLGPDPRRFRFYKRPTRRRDPAPTGPGSAPTRGRYRPRLNRSPDRYRIATSHENTARRGNNRIRRVHEHWHGMGMGMWDGMGMARAWNVHEARPSTNLRHPMPQTTGLHVRHVQQHT